jgi:hypothetical protein
MRLNLVLLLPIVSLDTLHLIDTTQLLLSQTDRGISCWRFGCLCFGSFSYLLICCNSFTLSRQHRLWRFCRLCRLYRLCRLSKCVLIWCSFTVDLFWMSNLRFLYFDNWHLLFLLWLFLLRSLHLNRNFDEDSILSILFCGLDWFRLFERWSDLDQFFLLFP